MNKNFEIEYLKREIEGKSNIEIVVMLYDAGIKFMTRSISAIEQKNIEQCHHNITKAQNIVRELSNMLDMEQGGDISANLFNLYSFILERLLTANVRKETKLIKEAMEIFTNLRSAWVEIAKQSKEGLKQPALPIVDKKAETKEKKAESAPPGNSADAQKTVRSLFKNVTPNKDKPYKPFSIKG